MNMDVKQLEQKIHHLEDEVEIVRRLASFEDTSRGRKRIYRFIHAEKEHFPVTTLCRVCRVSRSAYYDWASSIRIPTMAQMHEAYLANAIFDVWKESYRRYGAPRIAAELMKKGYNVSERIVARIMAELHIEGICGRKKIKTTRRDPTKLPARDLVERDFTAGEPDALWLTDVTYIPTKEGWLYLCGVLDVFTRRLLGWSIADHLRTELCSDALLSAIGMRGLTSCPGTIFHSDHGCQYTSDEFEKLCCSYHITQSMGSVGDSYDDGKCMGIIQT